MHRYQILIEYVGTNFYGWQCQKKQITVQGTVEKILKKVLKEKVRLYGYNNEDLREFNQENINKLLKSKLSEKKLIKPIYLS